VLNCQFLTALRDVQLFVVRHTPCSLQKQEVTEKVQLQIEQYLSKSFTSLTATHYRRQVVAGMIYHIRVMATERDQSGDGNGTTTCVLHIRVYHPLFEEPLKLQAVEVAKPDDTLEVLDVDQSLL